jgi:hypothetical protein
MADKKNEDYTVKTPEHEMRTFNASPSPHRDASGRGKGLLPLTNITNSPPISILAYCLASISMTVTNKYCVSGADWNLNFFYLAIQVSLQYDVRLGERSDGSTVCGLHCCHCHLREGGIDYELGTL